MIKEVFLRVVACLSVVLLHSITSYLDLIDFNQKDS